MADIPEDIEKKLRIAQEVERITKDMPGLFDSLEKRGIKAFSALSASTKKAHAGFVLLGGVLKGIEVTLKAIINVATAGFTAVIAVINKLTSATGALYDQFVKLGEQIFNFNLNFNKFLDQQTAGFFKLTQAGKEYVRVLDSSIDVLRSQGLAIDNVGQNMGSLFENTVLFRDATSATRRELTSFVSVLDQAGISADASTRMIQILNMTYLDTGKQTKAATERIIQFARAAGISGRVAAADFANAATVIAAHGEGMEEVFKGLLTQTRATGLGMNDILGIAGQFDTFEKSAQAVGKLNALLGGPYLNSIKMVYMSEDERVRAVLAAMEASGKSWRSLDRFSRQAIAATLNISDMTKANELFSKGLIGFDMAAAKAKEAAKEQASLEKAAKQATDIMTNFQNVLKGFLISFRPLIDGAARFIDRLAVMNFESKQAIGKVGVLAAGVAMLAKTFGPLGLAGSLLLLYDNWEKIKDDFLGPGGMKILDSYLEKLKSIVLKIPGFIKLVATEIGRIWTKLMQDEEFKAGVNKFVTFTMEVFEILASKIKHVFIDMFSSIFMAMKDVKIEMPGFMPDINIGAAFEGAAEGLQGMKTSEQLKAARAELLYSAEKQQFKMKDIATTSMDPAIRQRAAKTYEELGVEIASLKTDLQNLQKLENLDHLSELTKAINKLIARPSESKPSSYLPGNG